MGPIRGIHRGIGPDSPLFRRYMGLIAWLSSTDEGPDDGRGAYHPPPLSSHPVERPFDHSAVLSAAVKIQKIQRGRSARRLAFGHALGSAIASFARDVESFSQRAIVSAKGSALSLVLNKSDKALHDTFVSTLKPRLTPCPATPSPVRYTIHLLGDYVWAGTHASLVESLGSVLADRFIGESKDDEPHSSDLLRVRYNTSREAWRAASCLGRCRMLLMRARAIFLSP